eukprot:TRINITY_DN2793_c0_g1_i2.p1 TRINITY_DN2793_c0_g1~~TRINITY_DN2793_c0_g1_i2.p1  ORF type:complete len:185 (-),score=7.64 TRINITY_DN2793_c0_g1_i2:307-861(-)
MDKWTVGWGFTNCAGPALRIKIDCTTTMTQEQADAYLEKLVNKQATELASKVVDWKFMSDDMRTVLLDITHQAGVTGGLAELNSLNYGASSWGIVKLEIRDSAKLLKYGGPDRLAARASLWEDGILGTRSTADKYFSFGPCIAAGSETLNVIGVSSATGECLLLKQPTQSTPYLGRKGCNRRCS